MCVQDAVGRLSRRGFMLAGVAALGCGSRREETTGRPVILGEISLSFYTVTAAVVREVLERVGHSVEMRSGTHEEMFPLLERGAIDLMAAAWLPEGHAAYWAQYGGNAAEVSKLYDGAHFFWAVPGYVPESEVTSISDLAEPSVATLMTKRIQGIGAGATISVLSQKAVTDSGLGGHQYAFQPGTPDEWKEAYQSAVARQQWFVFPTWAPHYLNKGGNLRPLKDPRGTLGGPNHASLIGPHARVQSLPLNTQQALSRIELGIDGVTETASDELRAKVERLTTEPAVAST